MTTSLYTPHYTDGIPSGFEELEQLIQQWKWDFLHTHPEYVSQAKAKDPALNNFTDNASALAVIYEYPGLTAVAAHEKAHALYVKAQHSADELDALSLQVTARHISEMAKILSGIDIHPGAQIAPDFFIDHGTGVVIGETAIIGSGVFSLHGVTLGGSSKNSVVDDNRVFGGKRRHPSIGDNVTFGSNVRIYGPCAIGDNVTIGVGATLIDCEIGNNVKIGAGVSLYGVKIPDGAELYNESPTVIVSNPEHLGKIEAKAKQWEFQPRENIYTTDAKKSRATEFVSAGESVQRRETLAHLRSDNPSFSLLQR